MADHHPPPSNEYPPLCAPPPLDHLRPAESAPISMPISTEGALFDRKKGNPGPKVKAYGIGTDSQSEQAEDEDEGQPEELPPKPEEKDSGMGEMMTTMEAPGEEIMMSEIVMRRCLRCKRPQMKVEGCNKLTCQCGAKMCYLCRKPIEDYIHFCQCPTDPEIPWPCGKCKLFADPGKVDDKVRDKLMSQLQEELMELKLKQDKAPQSMVAKMTGTTPPATPAGPQVTVRVEGTPYLPLAPAVQAPLPPQQRQFAAIFGGP